MAVRISELNLSFGNQFRLFILGFSGKESLLNDVTYMQGDTLMFTGVNSQGNQTEWGSTAYNPMFIHNFCMQQDSYKLSHILLKLYGVNWAGGILFLALLVITSVTQMEDFFL